MIWNAEIVLAYRMRRPVGQGRGHLIGIARSRDGERFVNIGVINKDEMDAESLKRPALAVTADGTWRLYVSCTTRGSWHWRVEVLEAGAQHQFDPAGRSVVLPGDASRAVRDPVITWHDRQWQMSACIQPLDDSANTDRMWTEYATSADGLNWEFHGPALLPRDGHWDARGAGYRFAVCARRRDGVLRRPRHGCGKLRGAHRGRLRRSPGTLTAVGNGPAAQSPAGGHGLRYLTVLPLGDGRRRLYYELTVPGGAHELR